MNVWAHYRRNWLTLFMKCPHACANGCSRCYGMWRQPADNVRLSREIRS